MEATSSPPDINAHAASLLVYLNHQRDQGVFCDCVLRQGQNSDQLYHAHRCVLAASSPVLASILSSSGALVDLQDPSLSDSVLPSLLDYIYTGVLPNPLSVQEYYRLLSAACQMQMKELQGALSATWLQIQGNAPDGKGAPGISQMCSFKGIEDTYSTDLKTFKDCPSSPSTYFFQRLEPPSTQLLPDEMSPDRQINSVSTDASFGNGERSMKKQDANGHTITDKYTESILESTEKGNASDYRQVTSLTQQDSMRPKADKSVVHGVSGYVDEHHSPDFLKADIKQSLIPEEELLSTYKERKRCSSSPSLSPPPCCGAVPVICHSSRAAVQSEVSAGPPHNQASESSVQSPSFKMTKFSLLVSTDSAAETITAECYDKIQDPRSTIRHTKSFTDCKGNKDYDSNNVHQCKSGEKTCKNSSHNMNNDNQIAQMDSLQSHTEHHGEYVVQNIGSRRGFKHQMEKDFDPVPSKKLHLNCFECQRKLLTTVTQEQSKDQGAVVSLPMEVQDTGNDCHCKERLEVEGKRERSYSSRCLPVTDIKEKQNNPSESKRDWHSNIYNDDKSGNDDISSKHEYKVRNTQTSFTLITSLSGKGNLPDSFSSDCCKVLDSKKSSRPKTVEPQCFLSAPLDNNISGTIRYTGQTDHWYLRYQGEPRDDASLQESNDKPSEPGLSPDLSELSGEVNVSPSAFSGHMSLIQHFPEEIEDQSDVDTTHSKPHVFCQHGSDTEVKQCAEIDTVAIPGHEKAELCKGSSVAIAESFDEPDTRRDGNEGNLYHIKHCLTLTQSTCVLAVSKPNEEETKISSSPVCSPLSERDCDQVSKPSTVAVCMPSSLPASVPTDTSVHLSTPNPQPFQCSLCDRSFSQRGSLNRHVRSHLGVRPFQCPCCPMTFSRQYRVTEHMRVHQRCGHGNGLQKTYESLVTNNEERPQK